MADLAIKLIRIITRGFSRYKVEHVLVIEALIIHSTLSDHDLAHVLGMQPKPLRKLCGLLREDHLLCVESRAERKADGSGGYHGGTPQAGKERVTHRDWYYINYHRAIDAIKLKTHMLRKHIESQTMPTTEKKDLICVRCKSQYTELEAMDRVDAATGVFSCHRCGFDLEPIEEDEQASENQVMKRFNTQFAPILSLLQEIDQTTVPENDFATALSNHKPVPRADTNPGARMEVVDLPKRNLQSTKGLDIKPEKVAVQVQDDDEVKRENEAAEAAARRQKELQQNALPAWISKSTISGDITTVGAKEEKARREREAYTVGVKDEAEDKKGKSTGDDEVMAEYWKELALAQEREAAIAREEDGEDEDDDDEFEDVDVTGDGSLMTGTNTPMNGESSNATDDERDTKRSKIDSASHLRNGDTNGGKAADTPAASDEDDDDLEFENV